MVVFKLKYSGPTPAHMRKHMRAILRKCFEACGVYWHRELRPKHFTNAATREYGYTPRVGEAGSKANSWNFARTYTGRKLKKFGHTRPLVYTGESRRLTELRDVRATSKGVRIVMRAPRLNYQNRNSQVKPREELVRVTDAEAKTLAQVFGYHLAHECAKIKDADEKYITAIGGSVR